MKKKVALLCTEKSERWERGVLWGKKGGNSGTVVGEAWKHLDMCEMEMIGFMNNVENVCEIFKHQITVEKYYCGEPCVCV